MKGIVDGEKWLRRHKNPDQCININLCFDPVIYKQIFTDAIYQFWNNIFKRKESLVLSIRWKLLSIAKSCFHVAKALISNASVHKYQFVFRSYVLPKLYKCNLSIKKSHNFQNYSRMPKIETADLSQSHSSLNLSQFQAYCLFHTNSSTATKNNRNMRLMLEINSKDS